VDDLHSYAAARLQGALTSAALLDVSGIAKRFGAVVALQDASIQVHAGEVHALMGANGAGKSTLVKILTGALRADRGSIRLRGKPHSLHSPAAARAAGLVSVYQDPALVPDLTVAQNLQLSSIAQQAVQPWLAQLGCQDLDIDAPVRTLALPLVRLVDLARALAAQPYVLLLDEITAALPADLTERVFDAVRVWRSRGHAVIFISHRLAEVSALADRATVLRNGRTVGVVAPARGGEERMLSLMLGPTAAAAEHAAPRSALSRDGPPALEVRDLSAGPLRNVSFRIAAGEVVGITALEGQGQEMLFACLSGQRRPESGSIIVDGTARRFAHPADAIDAGMVLVPADRLTALLPQRSVHENIALPFSRRLRAWGLRRLHAEQARVSSVVERLRIDTRAASEARRLSGGNQQKVVIGRCLASGFRVLLCFDPTRGIDIGTKQQIYTLLREIAASGAAVLLFTSELSEIALTCSRALVLFGGRLMGEMTAETADEATLLRASHGFAAASPEPAR
jgi:ribose transport system ATP-binding protein